LGGGAFFFSRAPLRRRSGKEGEDPMKLTKAFTCVLPGEIYPVELEAGQECPEEYEDSARAQGCLGKGAPQPKAEQTPPTAEKAPPAEKPEAGEQKA
jgi:hypothetical protein